MTIKKAMLSVSFVLTMFLVHAQVDQLGLGFGGSLMDYCIDQNETIWVGVDVAGLFKSEDRGASWQRMNNQVVSEHVSEIFVHPDDENLMLLGTRGALLRSIDRGQTWTDIRSGFPAHSNSGSPSVAIQSIIVDPHNHDVIYAAQGDRRDASKESMAFADDFYANGRIYKSTDRGLTWKNLRSSYGSVMSDQANIFQLAASNQIEGTLFAATSRGLFVSYNGGNKFKKVSGLPHDRILSVAISPDNNNEVYVTLDFDQSKGYGVYKSSDLGSTWIERNNGVPFTNEGKGIKPYHIIIDWKDNNKVYIAGTEGGAIWKSSNRGASWSNVYRGRVQDQGWGSYGGNFLKAYGFAMSPIDNNFLIAGEHWSHKTEDGGGSWYNVYSTNSSPYKNNGADFTVSDYVVPSPTVEGLVLMGQYDNGLYLSNDGGTTWENKRGEMAKDGVSNYLVSVTDIAFAVNGDIYVVLDRSYYEYAGGFVVKKSTDNGATWSIVLDGKKGTTDFYSWGAYHGLETHPTDPNTVFITSFDPKQHVTIRSQDAGATWEKIGYHESEGQDLPHKLVRQLEVDEKNPNTMYAVAGRNNNTDGRIYKSLDAGVSWVTINDTNLHDPRDISIDPNNSDIIYAAVTPHETMGGIYKSTDGGVTWMHKVGAAVGTKSADLQAQITANDDFFGATSVRVHPDNSNTILATFGAATGQWFGDYRPGYGVGISYDGGDSWKLIGQSLIRYGRLYHIEFDLFDHNIIYTGSGGSGGFKIDLSELIDEQSKLQGLIDQLKTDESQVTIAMMEEIGIKGMNDDNLSLYQTELKASVDDLYMNAQVQFIVDEVNTADVTTLDIVLQRLGDGQAHLITEDMLEEIGVVNLYSELMFEYHDALGALDETTTLSAIQEVIDQANIDGSLILVNTYLERRDITYGEDFFNFLGLTGMKEEYQTNYDTAFLAATLPLDVQDFQSIVTRVTEVLDTPVIPPLANSLDVEFSLFPNPVKDRLKITLGNASFGDMNIRIIDLSGQQVLEKRIKLESKKVINVAGLAKGVYLIQIESNGINTVSKFVKE